jgi:PAS domain-containing protein
MAEPVHFQPPTVLDDPIRIALDCLEEGFQIIGRDWRYVYVNPAAARHGRP